MSELPVASTVNQLGWLASKQAQIKAFVTPELESLIAKAHTDSVRLDALLDYRAGCKPYEEGKGLPPQTRETLEVKPFTSGTRQGKEWLPLLRGNDVQRYAVLSKKPEWISYGKWLAAPRTMTVFSGPRLLIQAIRNPSLKTRIVAAWTEETFITRINVYSLLQKPEQEIDSLALLAVLNSQFMNWLLMKDYGLHTYVITGVLALPIKQRAIRGGEAAKLRHLADRIVSAKKKAPTADTGTLEREIDHLVYALYGLTPEEIAIVEGSAK